MIKLNLIVNDNNAKKINQALDELQNRKRERCIYTTLSIETIIHKVEKEILNGIPKNKWENFTFEYIEGATDFPKKYKFTPMGTSVVVKYQKKQWRVIEIDRVNCNHKKPFTFHVTPETLCDSIIDNHFAKINE